MICQTQGRLNFNVIVWDYKLLKHKYTLIEQKLTSEIITMIFKKGQMQCKIFRGRCQNVDDIKFNNMKRFESKFGGIRNLEVLIYSVGD